MSPSPLQLVVALLVLAAIFGTIQRLWPALPEQRRGWRQTLTDVSYWFFTPFVTRNLTRIVVFGFIASIALAAGAGADPESLAHAFSSRSPIARQPVWLQALELLFLGDLFGYWIHRATHARALWPIHAVHHSSERLDWLSSVRVHPLNDLFGKLVRVVPLFVLGFTPEVLAGYVPVLLFLGILLHANVPWSFGPLRYVIASPVFHRWHHTSESQGKGKNFAGLFPVWDLLFGTFYLPKGRQPTQFGIEGESVPAGFWAQLAYPFKRSRSA